MEGGEGLGLTGGVALDGLEEAREPLRLTERAAERPSVPKPDLAGGRESSPSVLYLCGKPLEQGFLRTESRQQTPQNGWPQTKQLLLSFILVAEQRAHVSLALFWGCASRRLVWSPLGVLVLFAFEKDAGFGGGGGGGALNRTEMVSEMASM